MQTDVLRTARIRSASPRVQKRTSADCGEKAAMDTIAGAKILQERFKSAALQPDQAVLHGDRRATFVRMNKGAAIIRYWGDSHAVAVPPRRSRFRP
jgi:hypothetical protein